MLQLHTLKKLKKKPRINLRMKHQYDQPNRLNLYKNRLQQDDTNLGSIQRIF